ncbi:MAG: hypothetical protein LBG62_00850 [Candidatus Methanoplasma sp.]|jgi:hypothetical protein|nr:hypothetical protein [Candidatus Methanoplasma sp.]
MRKIVNRPAKTASSRDSAPPKGGAGGWFGAKRRPLALLAIIAIAFALRFVFAYGVSADGGYALSGGSGASNHLHIIESILSGSYSLSDSSLNYPYGASNSYPPLLDFVLAGVAGIATAAGVSAPTAAAGVLAFSTPVFAAVTCWPVYMVAKRMFDDEKIGLLAAFFYAMFALLIMTTVFSNGTEMAFVGMLFVFMLHFLLKALARVDESQPKGLRSVLRDRSLLAPVAIAGLLFACIALSWGYFRIVLISIVFIMFAQAAVDRFRSKEVAATVGVYGGILAIGLAVSALYYIPAGMWGQIFSGPFVLGALALAAAALFAKTARAPWVLTVPIIAAGVIAFLAVLYFAAGDLFSAVVHGNSLIGDPLVRELSSTRHTSISAMAAYYGWLTLWLPALLFLYMLWKYRGNADSRKATFVMWWLLAMFTIGWYSSSYAVLAGAAFAAGSAAAIIMVLRAIDVRAYVSSMRGNGPRHALRKMVKPIPFAAVLAIVALIAVPNTVYAFDAATPTNTEKAGGYFGGLGYTVQTDDVSVTNPIWSEYSDKDKSGALATWFGYTNAAAATGKFSLVTDGNGSGSSMVSSLLLSKDGPTATSILALRMILASDIAKLASDIGSLNGKFRDVLGEIKRYADDPSMAVREVLADAEKYPGLSPKLTEENALYILLSSKMTQALSESEINALYGKIGETMGQITYVAVDRTMLPLYTTDGSLFGTLAYLGSYQTDGYGAPVRFFTYDTYYGSASYKDAMYETFFWKAFIGPSPAAAGFSDSSSLLNALALSKKGDAKTVPGYGLNGYKIAYWHVMYNPDEKAEVSSDGWKDMNAFEAMALQEREGGLINYVSGAVMLEYSPGAYRVVDGMVNYQSPSGAARAEGISVSVYVKNSYDDAYVLKSAARTTSNGNYSISVPSDGTPYYVTVSSGGPTGASVATYHDASEIPAVVSLPAAGLRGSIVVGDKSYSEQTYVEIKGSSSGKTYQATAQAGSFSFSDIMPDAYDLTVYSVSGTVIKAQKVSVMAGAYGEVKITATSGKINVTATDDHGYALKSGVAVATDTATGAQFTQAISEGAATIDVVPATYVVSVTGSKVSVSSATVEVTSGNNKSASITAYDAKTVTVSGAPTGSLITIMSNGYTASSVSPSFSLPATGGVTNGRYTAYAVMGNMVYSGTSEGQSISLSSSVGHIISGTLKNSGGTAVGGKIAFYGSDGSVFIFTADKDGKFSALVPSGTYTMYSTGASGGADVRTTDATSNKDLGDVKMSESRNLTSTLSYITNMSSSSSKGVAFADVTFSISIGGTAYDLHMKTDTSGRAVFAVPVGYGGEVKAKAFDTPQLHMEEQTYTVTAGSTATSNTWSIEGVKSSSSTKYVKEVTVTSPYPMEITLYNDSTKKYTVGSSPVSVVPGQYNVKMSASGGYFFNESVYIYPGHSGNISVAPTSVATATLNASTSDQITVTATDSEPGKYFRDPDNSLVYYLERGKSFSFKAVSGSGDSERIAYGTVASASGSVTVDLSNKAAKATIKGYAGLSADGKVSVRFGSNTVQFDVTSGTFEAVVPEGAAITLEATLTKDIGSKKYTYTGSAAMAASEVKDGAKVNFPVLTTGSASTISVSGSGFSFSNGTGSFTLSVNNTGSDKLTYVVSGGRGWVLDKTYSLTVEPGATGTVAVSGRYDPAKIGAGSPDLSVIVSTLAGDSIATYVIDGSAISPSGGTATLVDSAEASGASKDAMNGYEYSYAVTITNNDGYQKTVTVAAAIAGGSGNWHLTISDKDGANILASGSQFAVAGYGKTTIYVKLMSKDGSPSQVPGVSVTVSGTGLTFGSDSGFAASGGAASKTLSPNPASADVTDKSVSGGNVYNEGSDVPAAFVALSVACILVLLITIWAGMKRGVFVRRR